MFSAASVANELIRLAKADNRSFTPLQIIKLTYIAHGWMLHLYGRPLIDDVIEAWRYGPVIPVLYRALKKYGGGSVTDELAGEPPLDASAQALVAQVYHAYGTRTGMQLSAMTHQPGTPWHQTWTQVGESSVISNDLIAEHYRQLAAKRTQRT